VLLLQAGRGAALTAYADLLAVLKRLLARGMLLPYTPRIASYLTPTTSEYSVSQSVMFTFCAKDSAR
jgi:hypothetical protein